MDRQIIYPGEVGSDTTFLTAWRSIMEALGYLAQGVFGTNGAVIGLGCTPTSTPSLTVNVAPGAMTFLTVVDNLSYGSLGTDTTDPLVKMGINISQQQFTLTAPTGGNNQYYLISAEFSEQDAGSAVLPYYNAANPAMPYSGPSNSGASQYTAITQTVALTLTAGTPAGSPTVPATPSGQTALYTIYVASGATAVTSGNIKQVASAPFPFGTLQTLTPGTKNIFAVTPATQGNWTVPNGIYSVKLRLWGGGGAGGSGFSGAGGGGAGGGYSEGFVSVTPGQQYFVTVGNGGSGGASGGASSFGSLMSVTGGSAGANGSGGTNTIAAGGASGGTGTSGTLNVTGSPGAPGLSASTGGVGQSGAGGAAYAGGGAQGVIALTGSTVTNGTAGTMPGCGGSGGLGAGLGGQGGPGLALIEW